MIFTPFDSTISPGFVSSAIPARLGGEVDDHRARPHLRDRGRRDQPRRRPTGDRRCRDHEIELGNPLVESLLLALLLLRRQLPGVPALGLLADDSEIEEGSAERANLLCHGRTDVETGDHGAEPPRGRDRLQAGDPGAEHEGSGGGDRAGSSGQHGQELRQMVGADQHALVSGNGGL